MHSSYRDTLRLTNHSLSMRSKGFVQLCFNYMHSAHFSLLAIVYEAHAFNSCGILSILTSKSTAGRSKVWSWNMCKWNKQWLSDSHRTPRQLVTGFLMKTRLRKSEGVKHITHTQKDQFPALEKELYRNYKKLRGQRFKRRAFGFRLNLVWWIQILTSNKLTKIKKSGSETCWRQERSYPAVSS